MSAKSTIKRSESGVIASDIMRATGKAKTVIWRWQERFGEKPNDFVASTLDQRRISSVRLWQNQVLTGQHRMRLTPNPDRGTNTKITFAIVLDHSSKIINGRQPIGLLNDMVREVQRILMGTEPESRRLKLI